MTGLFVPTPAMIDRRQSAGQPGWPGRVVTKLGLRTVSRSIESLVQDLADRGEQVTVVGLFQRPEYYEHSRPVYERLAGAADVLAGHVMAGFQGSPDDEGRGRVEIVLLPEGHELGEQWAVLCVSRRVCVGLVAYDTEQSGVAMSAESGRLFATELSSDASIVTGWLRRFTDQGAALLTPAARQRLVAAADAGGTRADETGRATGATLERTWWQMLERTDRLQRAERLMYSDPLTGALNRRFLDRYLDGVGSRAPAIGTVAFDFDDFKTLNDTYGHAVGDEALRVFADTVRDNVRESDVLVRLGGDEWLLLMPGIGSERTEHRARHILDAVAARELSVEGAHVRASAGFGVFPAGHVDLDAVDRALYRAKRSTGRLARVDG